MAGQALLKAVSAGRARQVRLLLDSGCSANVADDCGQTALIKAVFVENENSRLKILKMLLRKGALVSKADIVGRNAFTWGCIYGRDKDVHLLLEQADLDLDLNYMDVNGYTPLFHAVSSGNAATVKLVVEALRRYDLNVDVPDYTGYSPLMHAVRLGFDVCASILIHNGQAKVGVGMKYPKDFVSVEKWAVQSLRDRERVLNKNIKFLPQLDPDTQNKIRYRENRACLRRPQTPHISDDEDESSVESDMSIPSDSSSCDNEVFNYPLDCYVKNIPVGKNIPSSLLALSPTSSTIVNASEDDEFDRVSCPVDRNKSNSTRDINILYGLVSDQMSTSYRLPAKPPSVTNTPRQETTMLSREATVITLNTERSNVSKTSKKGKKNSESKKWIALKKNLLLERVKTQDKLTTNPRDSPWRSNSDESIFDFNEERSFIETPKSSALPQISDKRTNLVQTRDASVLNNYSEI